MAKKRRHVWIKQTRRMPGESKPDYCTMCGKYRSPATEKVGCRPTRLPGL